MVSLLSDKDVERIAAFDITESLNLYDPRFGNIGSNEFICQVCGMSSGSCLGHHASLSLGLMMFHPLIYKRAEHIINTKCLSCRKYQNVMSKGGKCTYCNHINYTYRISPKDLRIATSIKSNRKILKISDIPKHFLPRGYIVSKILIPPIHLRTPEDMEWPSDFQKLYDNLVQFIKAKKRKETDICNAYSNIVEQHGVTKILSGKSGIFKKIMMGKRVENSARAVITGDPNLELDEVAIPKTIHATIRLKVYCTKFNITKLKQLASINQLWWDDTDDNVEPNNILPGMIFRRALENGDFLLLNRQPSLSRFSLLCFRAKIRTDNANCFGINPQTTAPFNADFDGDEMNIFILSNVGEMYNLCHLSQCIRADNIRSPTIMPVQDVVTGCYLMSFKDLPISKQLWADCASLCSTVKISTKKYTSKDLLYLCIPNYKGEILTKKDLAKIIYELNGQKALNMVFLLQKIVLRWIETYGLTTAIKSIITPELPKRISENSDEYRERCHTEVIKRLSDTDLMHMVTSGAKGSITHVTHMAMSLGQQYIMGREGVFCERSYMRGLTPDEFFGHQMAAREGVVSTGTSTAVTGYLNRKACKIMADLTVQYNGTIADDYRVSEFNFTME